MWTGTDEENLNATHLFAESVDHIENMEATFSQGTFVPFFNNSNAGRRRQPFEDRTDTAVHVDRFDGWISNIKRATTSNSSAV